MLRWSWWRRWHQAWARYHHYRKRQVAALPPPAPEAPTQQVAVLDVLWRRLEPLLPPADRLGRPYSYPRRVMLEAMLHVLQTDCGWAGLPPHFPPWKTVYSQYTRWRKAGIWEQLWDGFDYVSPMAQLQL